MSIISAYLRLVRRWRWSLLLTMLIATFLLQPLWSDRGLGQLATFSLYALIFGGAIYAGRAGPWMSRTFIALLILALFIEALSIIGVENLADPLAGITFLVVMTVLVSTFTELLRSPELTPDSLVGAVFGYFMIATAWALLYYQLENRNPQSFGITNSGGLDTQLLYFSLITITTVGYGDITPKTPYAQIWAGLEAAVGTFYIAILIGRIVGELKFGRKKPHPSEKRPKRLTNRNSLKS